MLGINKYRNPEIKAVYESILNSTENVDQLVDQFCPNNFHKHVIKVSKGSNFNFTSMKSYHRFLICPSWYF
jgi:hypothetical protein